MSGYAQNLKKECVGPVAGQAVPTDEIKLTYPAPLMSFKLGREREGS